MNSGNRTQIARLVSIDQQLREELYPNRVSLAKALEVTPRTIGRDLDFLRTRLNAPIEYDPTKNGFFYSSTTYHFPLLQTTEGEVVALFLAQQMLAQLKGTPFEEPLSRTLTRLSELLPGTVSIHLQELDAALSVTPTALTEQDATIYTTLSAALLQWETLEIRYWTAGRNKESVRKVNPYHLTLLDGNWYLIAYCQTKREVLMFAVQRVREASPTGAYFAAPEEFEITEYLGNSFRGVRGEGDDHTVQLRFRPEIAGRIREKIWHPTQSLQENPDDSITLTLKVSNLIDLKRWILWWGADCEVLEPQELRAEIRETAKQLHQLYVVENE